MAWQIFEVAAGPCIAMLIPTAAHAYLENDSEMWNMYLDEVNEEGDWFTDAWKEDASGIVTLVSLLLLVPMFVSVPPQKLAKDTGSWCKYTH